MYKKVIREDIIKKRDNLSLDIKIEYDISIFNKLINSEAYKNSNKIFTYISFGNEIDTKEFIKYALNDGKEIYVPKTDKVNKEMMAVRIHSLDNMIEDNWGILEPKYIDEEKICEDFDLIIIPGLAFDRNGNRIGYGGGYYDKYFSKIKNINNKVALAYDFQILDNIQSEIHDIKVDYIISNNETIITY
ncbi:5-formyltetrahydrofolate cyclo-ligase [uncultured Clostridium sp.]|uniref:5-formyltetrahydrofolate cyclo-ligase n=1 Tax=uncultured Clostridium sp. TaxID=59620 RepID=UPI00272C26E5|nr:5-formyltetrahydrofolate cyclo-ligase [uncultured Clostridium sp.]